MSRPSCRDILLVLVGGKTPDVTSVRRTYGDIMAEQKLKAQQVSPCSSHSHQPGDLESNLLTEYEITL